MSSRSRRLTTLWFADIAGFTRLSSTDEALALRVMEVMRRCVRAAVTAERGTVIKFLGDGALAEFPSAEGAVMAALEAAARFKGATRVLSAGPYQLHIGIHVGDVTVDTEGDRDDIFGDGVNRAQRLEAIARPGQTLVSEEVFRLVRKRPELTFSSLGHQTAKGLEDEPFEVFLVGAQGEIGKRIEALEQAQSPMDARPRGPVTRYSRAVAVGITAGVATLAGLAVWSGFGGQADGAAPAAIPDTLRLPASTPAMAMPRWPARAPAEAVRAAASTTASVSDVADAGDAYLGALGPRELGAHELLPLLRRAMNEARDGAPRGARANAIRGIALFVVAREPRQAERAFQASIEAAPAAGLPRVMYAELLTAQGRFDEAKKQLDQARDKNDVSPALLDAARGGMEFRKGDFGDARGMLDRSLKAEDLLATRILLARAQIAQNKVDDALKTLSARIGSDVVRPWVAYARLRAERGKMPAPEQMLRMARRADSGYGGALLLLEAGKQNEALDALARLSQKNDPDLIWLGIDPEWAPVRGNPRFQALAARALGRR